MAKPTPQMPPTSRHARSCARTYVFQEEEHEDRDEDHPRQVRHDADEREQRTAGIVDGAVTDLERRSVDGLAHLDRQPEALVVAGPALHPCAARLGVDRCL
jgi:hypothetical protein